MPIRKFFKYAAMLFGVLLAILIGLSLFVNFYLTDERVERILIPRFQETLGRSVAMENLEVSLLRGIRITDFNVKEEDGVTDFFRADEFVLAYELLPLFRGRLIISQVRINHPYVRVVRDELGRFNFQTLAFLDQPPELEPRRQEDVVVLPLALTIDQVLVNQARIVIEDQLRELPFIDGLINASISIDTFEERLVYHGRYDLAAELTHDDLRSQLNGRGDFGPEIINFQIDGLIDNQQFRLAGRVSDWQLTPEIYLDLSSERLEIDRLLGLLPPLAKEASRGESPPTPLLLLASNTAPITEQRETEQRESDEPTENSRAVGLTAGGRIQIGEALFHNLEMRDLTASYSYTDDILRISDLNSRVAGGMIIGNGRVDLSQPEPAFQGVLRLFSLQAGQLALLLSEQFGDWLTGNLNSSLEFSGRGSAWPQISKELSGAGEFAVREGRLREFPVTIAVAELLDMPALRSLIFEALSGNLRVEDGRVLLNSNIAGKDFRIETTGSIGLDGGMDLPVILHLTGPLAAEIRTKAPLTRYLARANDTIIVNLRLTGPVTSPSPVLDVGAVGERLREEVEEKILRELDRRLPDHEEEAPLPPPARDFLDELLRR